MNLNAEVSEVKKTFWDREQLIQKWAHSRKVAIYLAVMLTATVALFFKLLDGGHWTDIVKYSTTGYFGANAVDGIGDALKSKNSFQDISNVKEVKNA